MIRVAAARAGAASFWLPWLAGAPLVLCMTVMALPEIGYAHALQFRGLYALAYLLWTLPLVVAQRALQRRLAWPLTVLVLLALTYLMSIANNALAMLLAVHWHAVPAFDWRRLFGGLDGCWLALIAFCAIHAVVDRYRALEAERVRVREALALAREAELRALRYQLHPHFLFNTLNAISTLITEQRSTDANRMLARLADLLRATLARGEVNEVSLAEELALTGHYLDIEKIRLGARLTLELRVGADLLQAAVPALLLQPLVENAIRHGIAPRAAGGRLQVQVERAGERLQVRLHNNGVASPADTEATSRPAIGLQNVRERLDRLYGSAHEFGFVLAANGDCTVEVSIPFRVMPSNVMLPDALSAPAMVAA
ncbi:sensor histidine kinase [Rhodanobacter ginsengiterrae]|uniref:sensor histidine kinase n=1 Tax=Rhodanobacter ginsengiterrae TaxID=2008451 RepID=UPI003CE873EF